MGMGKSNGGNDRNGVMVASGGQVMIQRQKQQTQVQKQRQRQQTSKQRAKQQQPTTVQEQEVIGGVNIRQGESNEATHDEIALAVRNAFLLCPHV